jgi:hypothetical protein
MARVLGWTCGSISNGRGTRKWRGGEQTVFGVVQSIDEFCLADARKFVPTIVFFEIKLCCFELNDDNFSGVGVSDGINRGYQFIFIERNTELGPNNMHSQFLETLEHLDALVMFS